MRKTLPRNEYGQFCHMTPIEEYVQQMCQEYFNAFPDVDIFDLQNILVHQMNWIGSMTMLSEVGKVNKEMETMQGCPTCHCNEIVEE